MEIQDILLFIFFCVVLFSFVTNIVMIYFLFKRESNIQKVDDLTKQNIKMIDEVTKEFISKNTETNTRMDSFSNSIFNVEKSFHESFIGVQKKINHNIEQLDGSFSSTTKHLKNFEDRLDRVKTVTFGDLAGKGKLGEALVRATLSTILGEETRGRIWFDPKDTDEYMIQFRADLKACNINPDFLIQLSGDNWVIIDAKTYFPGEKALEQIVKFEEEGGEARPKNPVRTYIDKWVDQLIKATSEMISKGYLDPTENRNCLFIAAPDKLVEYYIQRYSSTMIGKELDSSGTMVIQDTRAILVSFTSLTWIILELKARFMDSMMETMIIENSNWLTNFKEASKIADEFYDYMKEFQDKIDQTINGLKEIQEKISSGDLANRVSEFKDLTAEVSGIIEALENTEFKPRAKRGYNYIAK